MPSRSPIFISEAEVKRSPQILSWSEPAVLGTGFWLCWQLPVWAQCPLVHLRLFTGEELESISGFKTVPQNVLDG